MQRMIMKAIGVSVEPSTTDVQSVHEEGTTGRSQSATPGCDNTLVRPLEESYLRVGPVLYCGLTDGDVMFLCCCYPAVHEKIFVVFMVTSLMYELLTLIVFKWAHPDVHNKPHVSTPHILYRVIQIFLYGSWSTVSAIKLNWMQKLRANKTHHKALMLEILITDCVLQYNTVTDIFVIQSLLCNVCVIALLFDVQFIFYYKFFVQMFQKSLNNTMHVLRQFCPFVRLLVCTSVMVVLFQNNQPVVASFSHCTSPVILVSWSQILCWNFSGVTLIQMSDRGGVWKDS